MQHLISHVHSRNWLRAGNARLHHRTCVVPVVATICDVAHSSIKYRQMQKSQSALIVIDPIVTFNSTAACKKYCASTT